MKTFHKCQTENFPSTEIKSDVNGVCIGACREGG